LVAENLAQALGEVAEQAEEGTDLANRWVAESYAVRAAKVMLKLAQTANRVIDLSIAQGALIDATKDKRPVIQMLAGWILAHLAGPDAQHAVAAMALAETNAMNVRLVAFGSLAVSAKLNGSLLDDETIDAVYSLVGSQQIDHELRGAAAAAFGALNLPSRKVKNLILDQAKS
ncbi:unnamed protein product, partial [marine sediment metagenome]